MQSETPDGPGRGYAADRPASYVAEGTGDATLSGVTGEPARSFTELGGKPCRINAVGRHHGADERIGERLVERHVAASGADPRIASRGRHASLG